MSTQTIKTPSGIPIGQLVESGDRIVAKTMSGIPLAQYDKRQDVTMTMSGKWIMRGNVLASYLYDKS